MDITFKMTEQQVNAVAIKLPTFWTAQPNIWFTQAEAQFHIKNVTQDITKYYYVVSALDQATASRILDILTKPPEENKYDHLKQRLINTYGLNRRDRASRLLHINDLGDRKPSELMDNMLSLLDGHEFCLLAEQIFLEHLPDDIRMQIADSDFKDPRTLAQRADILLMAKQQSATHIVHQISKRNESTAKNNKAHPDWCYYHSKFGERARKCHPPCKYLGNEQAGRQQLR